MNDIKKTGERHISTDASIARGSDADASSKPAEDSRAQAQDSYVEAGGVSGDIFVPPSRAPRIDRDEVRELLQITANQSISEGALSNQRAEAFMILLEAHSDLRNRFKPAQRTEGSTPSDKMIRASVRKGYRTATGRTPLDSEIDTFVGRFATLIEDEAAQLGLVGTKPKAQRSKAGASASLPSREEAALRTENAIELMKQIEATTTAIETMVSLGHVDEAAAERAGALFEEAKAIAAQLTALAGHDKGLASALTRTARRADALNKAQRIVSIDGALRFEYLDSTIDFDDRRIDNLMKQLADDVDDWLGGLPEGHDLDAGALRNTVRSYIAFWSAGQHRESFTRLGYSADALRNSIARESRGIDDAGRRAAFRMAAARLISHLTWNGTHENDRPSRSSAWLYERFEEAMGRELLEKFNDFADEIELGRVGAAATEEIRREHSERFQELIYCYALYASSTHPERSLRDVLRQDGIDPSIMQGILANADNAARYATPVLELARTFFSTHVTGRASPEVGELRPVELPAEAAPKALGATAGLTFADYEDGWGVREYIGAMPLTATKKFKQDFEEATGISFETFLSWGSRRGYPKVMSDHVWATLIKMTENESDLRDLINSYPPKGTDAKRWRERVAGIDGIEELAELGLNSKPATIREADWKRFVERCISRGRPEDITVEPMGQGLRAILPAIEFLRAELAIHGMTMDPMDLLCAISPVMRRMRARAEDGSITMEVPVFMSELAFCNWSLATWAKEIKRGKWPTYVKVGTIRNHASGNVQRPEHWNVRKYAKALATDDRDQQELLYEFAEMLRFLPVIDSAMHAFDASGARLTYTPADMPSRLTLRFVESEYNYSTSMESPLSPIESTLFVDIQSGHYSQMLDLVEEHLSNLKLVPNVKLGRSDRHKTTARDLSIELREFRRQEVYYRKLLADGAGAASLRSGEETAHIRGYFRKLRKFVRNALFSTSVSGTIETTDWPLTFDATVQLMGGAAPAGSPARPVVRIDDLDVAAKERGLDRRDLEDLVRIRALAGLAVAHGDISALALRSPDAVAEAIRHLWTHGEERLEAAAEHLAALERDPISSHIDARLGAIKILRKGMHNTRIRRPILPEGRVAPTWESQWRQSALEMGMEGAMMETARGAISDYLENGANQSRFSAEALHRAIEANIIKSGYGIAGMSREQVVSEVAGHIAAFLPSIGVPATEEVTRGEFADEGDVEVSIARGVFTEYKGPFPQSRLGRTKIPILPGRLRQVVDLHCMESTESGISPHRVYSIAKAMIADYNRTRTEPSPLRTPHKSVEIPTAGLLMRRLEGFAKGRDGEADGMDLVKMRHSYFRLYEDFMTGSPIGLDRIEAAISESDHGASVTEGEIDFLLGFLEHQAKAVHSWQALVSNPSMGFAPYVKRNYNFDDDTRVDVTLFGAFARRYANDRLTKITESDPVRLSKEISGRVLGSDSEVRRNLATFLLGLFDSWVMDIAKELYERVELARLEIEDVSSSTDHKKLDVRGILSEAARRLGALSFDEFNAAYERLGVLSELMDIHPAGEDLRSMAARLHDEALASIEADRKEAIERKVEETESSLADLAGHAAGLAWLASDVHSRWRKTPRFEGMDADEIVAVKDQAETDYLTIEGMDPELETTMQLASELGKTLLTHGADDDSHMEVARIVESAREINGRTVDIIETSLQEAISRKAELDEMAAHEQRMKAKAMAEVRAAEAILASQRAITRVEAFISGHRDTEELYRGHISKVQEAIEAEISRAGESGEAFAAAVGTRDALVEEGNAISAAIEELIRSSDEILGDGEDEAHDVTRRLELSMDEMTGEIRKTLRTAIERLSSLLAELTEVRSYEAQVGEGIRQANESLDSTLDTAELSLPIGPARGIPKAKPIDRTVEATGEHVFKRAQPRGDPLTKQGSYIEDLARHSRILSTMEGSWLLGRRDADAVTTWIRDGRSGNLHIKDVFDNEIVLSEGERGLRLVAHTELPVDGHPFATLVNNLAIAISENHNEVWMLAYLAKPSVRKLLGELLSVMAATPCTTNAEARTLIRLWSLANMERVTSDMSPHKRGKFFSKRSKSDIPDAIHDGSDIVDPSYTPEVHARFASNFANVLQNPEVRNLRVNLPFETRSINVDTVEFVDLVSDEDAARKALADGTLELDTFEVADGTWSRTNLRDMGVTSLDQLEISSSAVGDSPFTLGLHVLMHAICSDTELMPLGWLFSWSKESSPSFHEVLIDLLSPIARSFPRMKPPLTLEQAQEEAIAAYRAYRWYQSTPPEVAKVQAFRLHEWIDSRLDDIRKAAPDEASRSEAITDAIRGEEDFAQEIKRRVDESDEDRHLVARVYLLGLWSTLQKRDRLVNRIMGAYEKAMGLLEVGEEEKAAAADFIEKSYKEHRREIVKDINLMRLATNMHSAPNAELFQTADDKLGRMHPETGMVGLSQRWAFYHALTDRQEDLKGSIRPYIPVLKRIVETFPEFSGATYLISSASELIGTGLLEKLRVLMANYDMTAYDLHDGGLDESAVEGFRTTFREIYSDAAAEIASALTKHASQGRPIAWFMTGETEPWIQRKGWSGFSQAERLYAVMREFNRISAETSGQIMAEIEKSNCPEPIRNMLRFVDSHPSLHGAVAALAVASSAMDEDVRLGRLFKFFEGERGAWNDPEVAAAFSGGIEESLDPEEAFVRLLIRRPMRHDIRNAMRKPMPGDPEGRSIAESLTGLKEPWIAGFEEIRSSVTKKVDPAKLLPKADLEEIEAMQPLKLMRHVERRIMELGLLPANPEELGEKLAEIQTRWSERAAADEPGYAKFDPADQMHRVMLLALLVLETTDAKVEEIRKAFEDGSGTITIDKVEDEDRSISEEFHRELLDWLDEPGPKTVVGMLSFAYAFMVNMRDVIRAAATGEIPEDVEQEPAAIAPSKGGNGGGESSGGTTPADSGSNGSTPPTNGGSHARARTRGFHFGRTPARSRAGRTPVRMRGMTAGVRRPVVVPRAGSLPFIGARSMLGPASMPKPFLTSGLMVH